MASTNPDSQAELASAKKLLLVITERDIVFNCPACGGELVVDVAGAGLECPCSHCGRTLKIPERSQRPAAASSSGVTLQASETQASPVSPTRHFDFGSLAAEQLVRRMGDLTHQLKENRSQDTEMRGHVSRATMELHRLQLKLKKLQERQADIEAEITALRGHLNASKG